MKNWEINRRHLLRASATGMGNLMIGLPLLEAMLPSMERAYAAGSEAKPVRFAGIFMPNGHHMQNWNQTTVGTNSSHTLSPMIASLAPFKNQMSIFKGLDCIPGFAPPNPLPGDHGRTPVATWCGHVPYRTANPAQINAGGPSIDQRFAQAFGALTRKASIQMCTTNAAGDSDSYAPLYQKCSWANATTGMPKILDPRDVFDQLFGGMAVPTSGNGDSALAKIRRRKQSVLDFVMQDAKALKSKVGLTDKQRMDQYLEGIYEMEANLNKEITAPQCTVPSRPASGPTGSDGVYLRLDTHMKLFFDLAVLAMQCDASRIFMFMFDGEGSNRSLTRELGFPGEWHGTFSHHSVSIMDNGTYNTAGATPQQVTNLNRFGEINRFCYDQIAYFYRKLKETPEGSGTLFDNFIGLSVSGLADGNSHSHNNLPVIVAGGGGGTLNHKGGQCVNYPSSNPKDWNHKYEASPAPVRLTNLFVTLAQKIGQATLPTIKGSMPNHAAIRSATEALASMSSFGDSNGRLTALD
ncbi:MAG TPA: DUF1552 domain-containing protein [Oligoflexus sp.]|uniref:DUF1552 domain-containing protein n=1 Tax=Oligoflexus sp. TaxID=1971216 RepID=UPI002D6C91E9|nr:DUF1552 domain-containing protein [Oligoflexus sp.]HYX32822.1 DUF1552 domain-containing protein [Oligoflexus sp.]